MTDVKPILSRSVIHGENMSRHQILEWVNNMVNGHYQKIEELCSGVAYCQILEIIFPNCINLKRIKMSAKLEHECFHNMKLFQGGLTRLKLDKTVPVERLIKGLFQDNYEFLQWLKKFFDSQAPERGTNKTAANAVTPIPIKPRTIFNDRLAAPKSLSADELHTSIDELTAKSTKIIEARDKSYKKLLQIEQLITDSTQNNENVEFCNHVRDILYKTDRQESSIAVTTPLMTLNNA